MKTFNMKVEMHDHFDNYEEEDIVKNVWPGMYTFLTRRKGVNNGVISLCDGAVKISWSYEDHYEDIEYEYEATAE